MSELRLILAVLISSLFIFYHPDCTVGFGISPRSACARGLSPPVGNIQKQSVFASPCPKDKLQCVD